MVSVSEAERLVIENLGRLPAQPQVLDQSLQRILRRPITADRDGPPFDRATLDGVCLRHADWAAGRREFAVVGVQAAGAPALPAPAEGVCLEIMTGAIVPAPCDCVLRLEDYERDEAAGLIRARGGVVLERGTGVHARGSDFRKGDELGEAGRRVTARELAVAASCGRTELMVNVLPRIAILTTGDELVEIEDEPKEHEIRRSNDLAIRAVLQARGQCNFELNHLPDSRQAISWNLERLLQQADVIIITGGVSRGRFDYVPDVLVELGVRKVFHGVAQRPGKPMFFGVFERPGDFLHPEDTRVVVVFALPGNPVSALTCLHRYVTMALDFMCGLDELPVPEFAVLKGMQRPLPALTHFVPVRVVPAEDGRVKAEAVACNTSGDFASLMGTDGFVEIAPGVGELAAGAVVPLFRWS